MKERSPLFVIFLTVFLDLLGFGIIIPVLPFYAERYGATPVVVTLLGTSYSLMQFLFAPLWGRISDRIGRRPVLLAGIAMSAVGYTIFGLAGSLPMLFLARILAGIGNANIATAQAYIADVTTHENRAKGMGLIGMSFGLGFILGPVIGWLSGELGAKLGTPDDVVNQSSLPAFVAAGMALLDLLLASMWLKESLKPGEHTHTRRGWLNVPALSHALRQPVVGLLLVMNFVSVFGWSKMEQTFGLLIERLFVTAPVGSPQASIESTRLTGIALCIIGFVSALIQGGLIGKLTTRFGERRLLLTGLFLNAVALSLLSFAPSFLALVPVLLAMAVASGLTNPSLSSLLSRSASSSEQGTTLGLGQSLGSLARATGPILGGYLFQRVGIHAPYLVAGGLIFAAGMLGLGLRDPEPVSPTTPG